MPRSRLQQLSRTAYALAALFASFPIAGRLILGEWAFEGASGIAGLFLTAAVYLHIRSRRMRTSPDPALMLDEAIEHVRAGETQRALRLLNRTIAENPWFWQAYQRRGELHLLLGEIAAATADLDDALRLAPDELQLQELRAQLPER